MRKPAPKYRSVSDAIESLILAGRFGPRGRLPSELRLAKEHDVSLGTIRRALELLERRGAVVRRHGAGTFATAGYAPPRESRAPDSELRYFRFIDQETGTYLPVHSRVTAIDRILQNGHWSTQLGQDADFIRLMRLLRVGDEFEIDSAIYFRTRDARGLLANRPEDFDGVLIRDHVRRKFGLETANTTQTIRSVSLPTSVCRRIGALPGTAGLRWDIVSVDRTGHANSVQRVHVPQTDRPLAVNDRAYP